MLFNFSYPQIVYKQSAQPDNVAGALWLDTDDNNLYYCDGAAWTQLNVQTSAYLYDAILRNSIAILQLKAAASAAAPDYDSIICDITSDADGYDNTINTANTTAFFHTNTYKNLLLSGTGLSSAHSLSITATSTKSVKCGFKIKPTNDCVLNSVVKNAGTDATKCYLHTGGGALIGSADFSGNTATFSTPLRMTAGASYQLSVDKAGANYTANLNLSVSGYPILNNSLTWEAGIENGASNASNAFCIVSATIEEYSRQDAVIETNAATLSFTPTNYQLYAPTTTSGTGSVTYDISFDNGANYATGKSLNTAYEVTANSGAQVIIKLNLNAGASAGSAEATGYALMVW